MKEIKYKFIGNDGEFKKGEILTVVEDIYNTDAVKLYSNGEVEEWLYSEHSPDVEPIRNFEAGSKWVAKCDITASDDINNTEPLREMTSEQVAEEFNVKVVG